MAFVLVTEHISEKGLDELRSAGHEVRVRLDLSSEQLIAMMPGVDALIVRSATRVTSEVIDAGSDLRVVGRAGVGLDNVDVDHATRRGVLVVNAPHSNIISAAEHTIGLMLALARNIPQAHAALVEGRWERSRWEGIELSGKVLGVVGLGRIGTLVAERARAFGMKIIAHDPYVTPEHAEAHEAELVGLVDLFGRADFVSIHVARTPETVGLVGSDLLGQAKPGIRILNVSRGGIIDELALAAAIENGVVGGAALDVFVAEPTTDSPVFGLEGVIVTPHLGASTTEAQSRAGHTVGEQVALALAGRPAPYAVNATRETG